MDKQMLGCIGEDFAAAFLTKKGYRILERNYRCRAGEIDLIASKENRLCFIEVKTRQTLRFGAPAEAVTVEKQRHIKAAASVYLARHPEKTGEVDFQVIEIYLHHIPDAF